MLFIMNGRFTINTQYNSIDEHISRNKTSHQTADLNIFTENYFCLEQQQILHSKGLKFSEKIKGLESPCNKNIYTLSSKYIQNFM